jgi:hypothetical protein
MKFKSSNKNTLLYKNVNWPSFMSYLNQELDLQDVPLSAVGGPPDIDLMVNHLTSCNLEANINLSLEFKNLYHSHDFNVCTTESEAVETSFDIIRNSVIELTPKVAGPDQINNRLLKKMPRKAILYLDFFCFSNKRCL